MASTFIVSNRTTEEAEGRADMDVLKDKLIPGTAHQLISCF
ncbi:hypothetical protein [Bacteroides fluxus]|nr:hypothetical protein [Bacteroides fluxus]